MRQIVLDTETTGLDPAQGHRIIEIGCVELSNRRLTGNNYHVYIQPDRKIDEGAQQVHGDPAMLEEKNNLTIFFLYFENDMRIKPFLGPATHFHATGC